MCQCKELIDNVICDTEFIWNPSNCECECDKSCNIGEYSDYQNFKCRNKLVEILLEECSENIDGNEMAYSKTLNDYRKVYNSCTIYIVLFAIVFVMIIGFRSA